MARYSTDNTEGYSADDLHALNAAFDEVCRVGDLPTSSDELPTGSLLDHISETLLAGYDSGMRGDVLVTHACQN